MSLLKRLITRAANRQVSKLDELYQRHVGEECYIFGDGVSLKWMDLRQFADRTSILGNMLIYHKEVDALAIPYCCITEPNWFWPIFPYGGQLRRHSVHHEYRKSIKQHPETLFFLNISNYPVARFSNALFVSRWYAPPFESSNPFRDRADSHQGTFNFQVSLAIYLGFSRIYCVGHDYTHFPSRSRYFYEKGEGVLDGNTNFRHEFISYAKQHVDLVTVTLDGCSETMDYVTYKDLTGKEPCYRNNIDIVDRIKLESLATWPVYSIF